MTAARQLSISEDVAERFRVADWHVVEVDGHDLEAVSDAIAAAKKDPRPSMIACRTVIAKGIARLQGQRGGHSGRLHPEDAAGGPTVTRLAAPALRSAGGCAQSVARCRAVAAIANTRHGAARCDALPAAERAEFERVLRGELPAGWREVLLDYKRARHQRGRAAGRHHDLCRDQRSAGRRAARAHGGLRRPRGADQPQAPPAGLHRGRPPRRLRPLRRARARDGRDGQRHGGARRHHPARGHLPRLLPTTSGRRCAWPR